MVTLFGTDGVRGLVNSTLMPELAYQLGRAAGAYFCKASGKHRFLIGMDTRISGSMLTAALSAGLCASGVDVDLAGVIPTPGIAYLTRTEGYDAGVMISASHNPFPDNGIKFFDKNGYKLPDETEEDIENILRHDEEIPRPTGDKIGVISHRPELADKYRAHVLSTVQGDFKGLKIVTDSANGAASDFLPAMLEELGAEVTAIFHEPNGVNINNGCGSTHIETLQKKVLELGADCGIANDGDADRCLFVDEKGQVMDGDHLMLINALQMKKEGRLHENMVVGTVMSNLGFGKALKENGCQTVSTQVGDRYVLEEMLKHDYSIGGEQSGHIIFPEFNNGCGSTHIETLQKKVLELGADCGIANDGDADRCLFVDEKGQVMDGDHLMLINALQMKKEGRLHENMVVGTVMSNLGFGKALKENGCQTVSTQVGDRYVLEEMLKHDYSIGGEQSGHIIFPEFNTTGDGLITAVQTLKVLRESGKTMSELNHLMVTYPQILKNVEVYSKNGWEDNELIRDSIRAAEEELGSDGRILVRASGTEPLIRVMGEGKEINQLERIIDDIASVVEHELGVENN